jgi:hypothetical protein
LPVGVIGEHQKKSKHPAMSLLGGAGIKRKYSKKMLWDNSFVEYHSQAGTKTDSN